MSRSKQRVMRLAVIRDLRALSEQVAEARAVQSSRASREQQARCQEDEELLGAALDEWRAALAESRFDPLRASLHARAVEQREQTRAQSFEELAALATRLEEARRDYGRAQAGHRCAAELLKQGQRRHVHLRDEKILAARDDGNARRATGA